MKTSPIKRLSQYGQSTGAGNPREQGITVWLAPLRLPDLFTLDFRSVHITLSLSRELATPQISGQFS